MNAELEQRRREYEVAKQEVRDLVAGLSDEQFNRRTDETRWSVAECVDHLIVVGSKMVPLMHAAARDGRAKGKLSDGPFRYSALGRWFDRQTGGDELPPRSRLKVPKIYTPSPAPDRSIEQTVAEFGELQDAFVSVIEESDGLDLRRIKVTSAVTRLLRLSLGIWLKALAGHQRRHLCQAERVKGTLLSQVR